MNLGVIAGSSKYAGLQNIGSVTASTTISGTINAGLGSMLESSLVLEFPSNQVISAIRFQAPDAGGVLPRYWYPIPSYLQLLDFAPGTNGNKQDYLNALNTLYQQYQGQSVDVDGIAANAGQCVQWVDLAINRVFGVPYVYANAIDWWDNPTVQANFDQIAYTAGATPQALDLVVWGSDVGSVFGHIDIVAQDGTASGWTGYDSNWNDSLILQTINHSYSPVPNGFLRYKGITTTGGSGGYFIYVTVTSHPRGRQVNISLVSNFVNQAISINNLTFNVVAELYSYPF